MGRFWAFDGWDGRGEMRWEVGSAGWVLVDGEEAGGKGTVWIVNGGMNDRGEVVGRSHNESTAFAMRIAKLLYSDHSQYIFLIQAVTRSGGPSCSSFWCTRAVAVIAGFED